MLADSPTTALRSATVPGQERSTPQIPFLRETEQLNTVTAVNALRSSVRLGLLTDGGVRCQLVQEKDVSREQAVIASFLNSRF